MRTRTEIVLRRAMALGLLVGALAARPALAEPVQTLVNLQAAFEADVHAQARYRAFAERADGEGYGGAAALFRAAAHAEGVRARSHAEAIRALGAEAPDPAAPLVGGVGTTRANLLSTLGRENAERVATYPRLVEQARRDRLPVAILTLTLANRAEEGLVRLYQDAVARLESMRTPGGDFHVCEVCGHVVQGSAPDRCPVSLSGREAFTRVR